MPHLVPAAHVRVAALVLALLLAVPAAAQELSIPEVVRRARPSVVSIRSFDAEGRRLTMGSGFVGPDGRIVTNAHVVAGAALAELFDADGARLGVVSFAEAVAAEGDLAVLPRMEGAGPPLPLAAAAPEVGEPVVVIGSPEGFAGTVSEGIVSAFRTVEGQRLMQVSAPMSHGSSGGPVLDLGGAVIGVSVAVWAGGQNLNFAVPLDALVEVLAQEPARLAFPAAVPAPSGGEYVSGGGRGGRLRRLAEPSAP